MCVEIPDVRVGEPQVCGGVAVFPLFAGQFLVPGLPVVRRGDGGEDAGRQRGLRSRGSAVSPARQRRRSSRPTRRGRGGARRQAEPCFRFVRAGRRGKRHSRSRLLCRSGAMGLRFAKVRERLVLPAVACGTPCKPEKTPVSPASGRRFANGTAGSASAHRRGTCPTRLDVRREAVEEMRRSLPYAEGALGIAAGLGGKIVGIDVFDKPVTMAKLWDRLVQGLVLDAAATPDTARLASASDVAVKLYALKNMSWQQVDSVGLGEAYRGRTTTSWRPPWSQAAD